MRQHIPPRVSIGMPIRNGAPHLSQAIESFLGQDYEDFELIISDNASTDGSNEIAREFAAADGRVRYYEFDRDRGAMQNFNRVFRLARGEYFKWAAHDDWCGPRYLDCCVEVLDQDPGTVLCHTHARLLDEHDRVLAEEVAYPRGLASPDPTERFHEVLWNLKYPYIIFGLMRRRLLARTRLIGRDTGSDRILLGQLSLMGPMHQVPEVLFHNRHIVENRLHRTRLWWTPENERRLVLRTWRLVHHFMSVVLESDLGPCEKTRMASDVLLRYCVRDSPRMVADLIRGGSQLALRHKVQPIAGPPRNHVR